MDYTNYLIRKYPHIDRDDLDVLVEQAKEILINLSFKSQTIISSDKRAIVLERHKYWILRCVNEMIERMGITSVISYRENGISITFDSSQLSSSLISEIVPCAKII